jgi:hypothetical protein
MEKPEVTEFKIKLRLKAERNLRDLKIQSFILLAVLVFKPRAL